MVTEFETLETLKAILKDVQSGENGADVRWTATIESNGQLLQVNDVQIDGHSMREHLTGAQTAYQAADKVIGKRIDFVAS